MYLKRITTDYTCSVLLQWSSGALHEQQSTFVVCLTTGSAVHCTNDRVHCSLPYSRSSGALRKQQSTFVVCLTIGAAVHCTVSRRVFQLIVHLCCPDQFDCFVLIHLWETLRFTVMTYTCSVSSGTLNHLRFTQDL